MAFDEIPQRTQKAELSWLAEQGVKRILTHGGELSKPILANISHLKDIISWAKGQIEILPGGGITSTNCDFIAEKLNVQQVHGTKIVA